MIEVNYDGTSHMDKLGVCATQVKGGGAPKRVVARHLTDRQDRPITPTTAPRKKLSPGVTAIFSREPSFPNVSPSLPTRITVAVAVAIAVSLVQHRPPTNSQHNTVAA